MGSWFDYGCPPVRACRALGAHAAQEVPPPRPPVSRGSPPPAWAYRALLAHAALRGSPPSSGLSPRAIGTRGPSPDPFYSWIGEFPLSWWGMPCAGSVCCRTGGFPPLPWLCLRAVGTRGPSPTPSCLRAICARGLGGGSLSSSCSSSAGGSPEVVRSVAPPPVPAARLWRALLGGGFSSPSPPSSAARIRRGLPFRGAHRHRLSCVSPPRYTSFLGAPLWFKESPLRGVLLLGLSGVPPCSLAAHHGRALLGEGSPSPFLFSSAARVMHTPPFGGSPLLCLSVRWSPLLTRAPGGFVLPLLQLYFPASCVPMAIVVRRRPRGYWSSYRRGRSRAGKVCWRVPCAAGSILHLHLFPMAVFFQHGPRADRTSRQRSCSRASGLCCRVPRATSALLSVSASADYFSVAPCRTALSPPSGGSSLVGQSVGGGELSVAIGSCADLP